MNDWQPMATAPRDGTFILLLNKDGREQVAFFHKTLGGWKDWQSRERIAYQDGQCHGWQPANQDAVRALPLYGRSHTRAKERDLRLLCLPAVASSPAPCLIGATTVVSVARLIAGVRRTRHLRARGCAPITQVHQRR